MYRMTKVSIQRYIVIWYRALIMIYVDFCLPLLTFSQSKNTSSPPDTLPACLLIRHIPRSNTDSENIQQHNDILVVFIPTIYENMTSKFFWTSIYLWSWHLLLSKMGFETAGLTMRVNFPFESGRNTWKHNRTVVRSTLLWSKEKPAENITFTYVLNRMVSKERVHIYRDVYRIKSVS